MFFILIAVILARLEGLEDLAFSCQCYIIELSPGLGLRSLGSVPDVSLINHFSIWQFVCFFFTYMRLD